MGVSQLSPDERKALCTLLAPVAGYTVAIRRGVFKFPRVPQAQQELGGKLFWAVGEAIGVDWESSINIIKTEDRILAVVGDLLQTLISAVKNKEPHVG